MAYRQEDGKSNRLTFGAYPEVSLSEARVKRAAARKHRAEGMDPAKVRRDEKLARSATEIHTFEAVARDWLRKTSVERAASTQKKNVSWLEKNVFPSLGTMAITTIRPPDVLIGRRWWVMPIAEYQED